MILKLGNSFLWFHSSPNYTNDRKVNNLRFGSLAKMVFIPRLFLSQYRSVWLYSHFYRLLLFRYPQSVDHAYRGYFNHDGSRERCLRKYGESFLTVQKRVCIRCKLANTLQRYFSLKYILFTIGCDVDLSINAISFID